MDEREVNKRLAQEVEISEAMLVGLFWHNPELYYGMYDKEKVNHSTFRNQSWSFFFELGRTMFDSEVRVFDDIIAQKTVNELGARHVKIFDKYGGFDTVKQVKLEAKSHEDNFDAYYEEVQKYSTIKELYDLFGEKVVKEEGNYSYRNLDTETIWTYWMDKVNNVKSSANEGFDECYLLDDLDGAMEEWDRAEDVGMPFYRSSRFTKAFTGFARGTTYIFGNYSGGGKTSFTMNKVIMAHIEQKEKLLIIANEQDEMEWKKLLIVTALGQIGEYVDRQRLNEGEFTAEEWDKLRKAKTWLAQYISGEDKTIALVFLENYTVKNVERAMRKYANRGYGSCIVDTAKPTDDDMYSARWENFYESIKKMYQLARKNAGGLNMRVWINVQLGDNTIGRRYLDEGCLGESKKIKNEAGQLILARWAYQSEYKGGKNEVLCYTHEKDPENEFADKNGFIYKEFTLDPKKKYQLVFVPKNRRGKANNTGLDVLVFEVNMNSNVWIERGYAKVTDDRTY
ncbi:hypothetical protein GH892_03165 [Bacillus thuringiensis]|uniref:DnaB-like helicase C-terminal domain-containing protein n=1 Tax=Bacillus toyonensis TaxID=155322 RepID=UPI001298A5E0|nr:hypothetical protein [Bacillus thuringiensis]